MASLPRSWKRTQIGSICDVVRGSSPRPIADQRYFEGGTIPWIKIADATKSGRYLYDSREKVNEFGASFSRLLRKGSLIVAASGTLGYTQMLGVSGCIHDGWLYLSGFRGVAVNGGQEPRLFGGEDAVLHSPTHRPIVLRSRCIAPELFVCLAARRAARQTGPRH